MSGVEIVDGTNGQCASAVCMVRPASFGWNPQTASTNHLQIAPAAGDGSTDASVARDEFDAMVARLRAAGVTVGVLEDTPEPARPDAVFPNNWVSFHHDGSCVLYPMHDPNRRRERRAEAILAVASQVGFVHRRTLDLTATEHDGRCLEGTGSLVLDHVARVAYCARSPRSDETVARAWCAALGYELEPFDAATPAGASIYHTNVLLWIGERIAAVGLDWIAPRDRARVRERLGRHRVVVELADAQLARFAGNMLEVRAGAGRALVLSTTASASLRDDQRRSFETHTDALISVDVPLIERRGGGSVRCMLAEVP